jgi:hypothetical protein
MARPLDRAHRLLEHIAAVVQELAQRLDGRTIDRGRRNQLDRRAIAPLAPPGVGGPPFGGRDVHHPCPAPPGDEFGDLGVADVLDRRVGTERLDQPCKRFLDLVGPDQAGAVLLPVFLRGEVDRQRRARPGPPCPLKRQFGGRLAPSLPLYSLGFAPRRCARASRKPTIVDFELVPKERRRLALIEHGLGS